MNSIHVQPLIELVRCYGEGSYEDKSPYVATVNLLYENTDTVILSGLCGKFNKDLYLLLWEYLSGKNICYIKIERKGKTIKKQVPKFKHKGKSDGTQT